jgi:hypothetical protein
MSLVVGRSRNACSLTQCGYLQVLSHLERHIQSNELREALRVYVNDILRRARQVTIGGDDLTRICTRLVVRLADVTVVVQLLEFVEQLGTELSMLETLLLTASALSPFERRLEQWLIDLLMTMDLFNEQLYTKVSRRRTTTGRTALVLCRTALLVVRTADEADRPEPRLSTIDATHRRLDRSIATVNDGRLSASAPDEHDDDCSCLVR